MWRLLQETAVAAVQPSLEAIVMRALSKKADDRFPDARALLEALQRVPEPAAWI